jgi:glycerol uptake facilitator-like aquaporin
LFSFLVLFESTEFEFEIKELFFDFFSSSSLSNSSSLKDFVFDKVCLNLFKAFFDGFVIEFIFELLLVLILILLFFDFSPNLNNFGKAPFLFGFSIFFF